MTALEAEKETTIKLDNVEYSSEGPETRRPPAVLELWISNSRNTYI